MIAALVIGLPAVMPEPAAVKAIGAQEIAGIHLVPPRGDQMKQIIEKEEARVGGDTDKAKENVIKAFSKKSDTWVNPEMAERALQYEAGVNSQIDSQGGILKGKVQKVSVKILAMAVQFTDENEQIDVERAIDHDNDPDTPKICVRFDEIHSGPQQGEIEEPVGPDDVEEGMPYDNNTVWYTPAQTASMKFYESMIFGYKGAGRVRMDLIDPRDGKPGINLKGVTVQDYYDKVAGKGNVKLSGKVVGWIQSDHSEAFYGADNCAEEHAGGTWADLDDNPDTPKTRVYPAHLVKESVEKYNATFATPAAAWKFWKQYDANKDGLVDTFWMIHAGMGQEAGGGAQGDDSIWSHSSDVRYYLPEALYAYEDDPANPNDWSIQVGPYTFQPENAEVGVFSEEFGHNVFGLPDLYVTDGAQGSIAFWSIMESGAWGGWLGGTQPLGMPLWFRMIADCGGVACNWDKPLFNRMYADPEEKTTIAALEGAPRGAIKGARINLPRMWETIPNPVGTGIAIHSGAGRDMTDVTMDFTFDVPAAPATNILTIPSNYDIEEDWDYGYVMIKDNSDPANPFVSLNDLDGILTDSNPNGNLDPGAYGLTGSGRADLQFDLAAYAGKNVTLRLRYETDAAVSQNGWFVDDIMLDTEVLADFDTVGTLDEWTNSDPGWMTVPTTKSYSQYYLVELRNNGRYDGSARTAYVTTHEETMIDPDGDGTYDTPADIWMVDRVPYNIPAALIYYRNTKYGSTYAQRGYYGDLPSYGPKYQLLLVDVNEEAVRAFDPAAPVQNFDSWLFSFNARVGSYDAGLTMQPVEGFEISRAKYIADYDENGKPIYAYVENLEYPGKPATTVFDDRQGYYPGFFYADGRWYLSNRDGSAVIPAVDMYSTRVTDFDGNPLTAKYGSTLLSILPHYFGSGNPGDEGQQYGVMIELLGVNKPGNKAIIKMWNSTYGMEN
ncbi:hypothetical protein ADN01_13355 [Levilinea saccharolytica]|uniref:Peptidase M6-like domain-containing protein n=2 Tax=Levilinea saccharolytica TaxID=229921 RepID=A0A0P6XC79_9CHLR|nr:hypothetical protein ADN01_13355 [Levilinea saccharolytica]